MGGKAKSSEKKKRNIAGSDDQAYNYQDVDCDMPVDDEIDEFEGELLEAQKRREKDNKAKSRKQKQRQRVPSASSDEEETPVPQKRGDKRRLVLQSSVDLQHAVETAKALRSDYGEQDLEPEEADVPQS